MRIPFVDLGLQYKQVKPQFLRHVDKLCKKGNFILGSEVSEFEREFADYCATKYAVGLNSGTDALFLSLLSLGIGKGDEVIIPAFTFIASALAVSYTQAKPVLVDIDPKTYNIDVSKIEKAITRRTRAIIPVHLFGQSTDMGPILRIAAKYGLRIIEDAAQAHGAVYKRTTQSAKRKTQKVGSIGDIGCFSFYPTKNLGGFGDGGMAVTNDKKILARLRILRDNGRTSRYAHAIIGYNSRLDALQAAILRLKLRHLDKWNQMRRRNAKIYTNFLLGKNGISCPYEAPYARHIYHVYALQIKNRDRVRTRLKTKGIDTLIHYPIPVHLQMAYRGLGYKRGNFPVSERIARRIISLPMHPFLKPREIEYVARQILKAVNPVREFPSLTG
ncbi:MAG: DegT/DnrJ/EryC1/StrS family aminotransferase [Candidatus Omnitrophota bacterium]